MNFFIEYGINLDIKTKIKVKLLQQLYIHIRVNVEKTRGMYIKFQI